MDYQSQQALQQFKNHVGIKFQLYNSLFTSLPFHRIEKTGILLSLLLTNCEEGFEKKLGPQQIIDHFFEKHTTYTTVQEKLDLLFRFVQYAERQVVLFDALEDAAFRDVNDMNGTGTLKQLETDILQRDKVGALAQKLQHFAVRLVLTAHPTQFYPGTVLGIIHDLSKSLAENNASQINMYLQQLGKTPFFKKQKPTPFDEAISLVWYLENVFYTAAGRILNFLHRQLGDAMPVNNPVLQMGFWPGGDRDGNPFVNCETTLKVADALRGSIIKCYYLELRRIRRRLTFEGVENVLADLERNLYNNIFIPGQRTSLTASEITGTLRQVRETLVQQHNSLFVHLVEGLIYKVELFGLHFASLDIRQDSTTHSTIVNLLAQQTGILPANYETLEDEEKITLLSGIHTALDTVLVEDEAAKDTLHTMAAIRQIQQYNGPRGCHRYIISQCGSALHIAELLALLVMSGWQREELPIDIVPLFETISDLEQAPITMRQLYGQSWYSQHLARRANRQTIMLGFSDGTKDGGYLMANWRIFTAKKALTALAKEYGVEVVFFDGRGGPPARGGGKTHKFYASMGNDIANNEIQLTIQGQTVSSNFGIVDAAQYNMEQLINAGVSNDLFDRRPTTLTPAQEKLMEELAIAGYGAYTELKKHPGFLDYLAHVSPLRFYADTNIGSRPAKRGSGPAQLSLKDLRAIPYVGAWSQLKQNITGYYGVGTALQQLDKEGRLDEVKELYNSSLFFKTLVDNCEMAMKKCFFPLTEYLSGHPRFGEIWNRMYNEYELTKSYLFRLSGRQELMAAYPVEQLSVQMRERIVLPLLTIQQYAIARVREQEEQMSNDLLKPKFEKLVMRCAFGIINAGRNSA